MNEAKRKRLLALKSSTSITPGPKVANDSKTEPFSADAPNDVRGPERLDGNEFRVLIEKIGTLLTPVHHADGLRALSQAAAMVLSIDAHDLGHAHTEADAFTDSIHDTITQRWPFIERLRVDLKEVRRMRKEFQDVLDGKSTFDFQPTFTGNTVN